MPIGYISVTCTQAREHYGFMNLSLLTACLLSFALVKASHTFPNGGLPYHADISDYLPHVAKVLKSRSMALNISYPSARVLITMNKYFEGLDDECNLAKNVFWPVSRNIVDYKYKSIISAFRNSHSIICSELGWNDIVTMEKRISYTITMSMMNNRAETLEFLQEALVDENPLDIFGSMQRLSLGPELKHSPEQPYILTEEYRKLILLTVLKELKRIFESFLNKDTIPQAALVDFLVLIRHHCLSINYFSSDMTNFLDRFINLASKMPKTAFDAYGKVLVFEEAKHKDHAHFLSAVCEEMKATNPVAFAENLYLFEAKNFNLPGESLMPLLNAESPPSKLIKFLYQSLLNPISLDELRLYMAAISSISVKNDWIEGSQKIEDQYHALFVYALLKRMYDAFGESMLVKLTGYHHSVIFDLLQEIIERPSDYEACTRFCIDYGLLESIKYLHRLGEIEKHFNATKHAIFALQNDIVLFFLSAFETLFDESNARTLLLWAAEHSSFKVLSKASALCNQLRTSLDSITLYSLMLNVIKARKFDNFDFLHAGLGTESEIIKKFKSDAAARRQLITEAFKCQLPEERIIKYLGHFDSDWADDECTCYLNESAALGYLNLVKKFSTSGNIKPACYDAIQYAAKNGRIVTVKYLISRLGYEIDFLRVARTLVFNHCAEGLRFAIEKSFGFELTPTLRADILIACLRQLDWHESPEQKLKLFCEMAGWKAKDVQFSGVPSSDYCKYFGPLKRTEDTDYSPIGAALNSLLNSLD